MKKLLTLVLLLGMATMAQATLVGLSAVGGTVVSPGDTVTIQLKADSACDGWNLSAISSSIVLDGLSNLTAGTGSTFIDGYTDFGGASLTPAGLLFDNWSAYCSPAVVANVVLMSFDVDIPTDWDGTSIVIGPLASGTAVHDAYGYDWDAATSYATLGTHGDIAVTGVTLTPEPITLTLLGLGGLALLRRRHA